MPWLFSISQFLFLRLLVAGPAVFVILLLVPPFAPVVPVAACFLAVAAVTPLFSVPITPVLFWATTAVVAAVPLGGRPLAVDVPDVFVLAVLVFETFRRGLPAAAVVFFAAVVEEKEAVVGVLAPVAGLPRPFGAAADEESVLFVEELAVELIMVAFLFTLCGGALLRPGPATVTRARAADAAVAPITPVRPRAPYVGPGVTADLSGLTGREKPPTPPSLTGEIGREGEAGAVTWPWPWDVDTDGGTRVLELVGLRTWLVANFGDMSRTGEPRNRFLLLPTSEKAEAEFSLSPVSSLRDELRRLPIIGLGWL